MLTEMIKYGCKIEERVKTMQSQIKENVQGTNSEGKETGTQINDLEQKEEINIQPEQNEETRIQKNEETSGQDRDVGRHTVLPWVQILWDSLSFLEVYFLCHIREIFLHYFFK